MMAVKRHQEASPETSISELEKEQKDLFKRRQRHRKLSFSELLTAKIKRLNLFWRTFALLCVLLLGCILAWLQTLRAMEFGPHAMQTAQQISSMVNLSRAALIHADVIARMSLIDTMRKEEGLSIIPRETSDVYIPFAADSLSREVAKDLAQRLGPSTLVASSVNGRTGIWVSFLIDTDPYWMLTDTEKLHFTSGRTWMIWLSITAILSLAGAALIARLINQPLKDLSEATGMVHEGNFAASHLDERVPTSEIREVNIGFNRMVQRLSKIEKDRALMLAGISHDLRTPLARLRLEAEMSVSDPDARAHMASDIAQLDAIIDKFLDYARPDKKQYEAVSLWNVIEASTYPFEGKDDIVISFLLEPEIKVLGDSTELIRIFTNLVENARRYGKTPGSDVAEIEISAQRSNDKSVLVVVRDHGAGVDPNSLVELTQPFYRGESARTTANGAGLGLSIVDKTVRRMGGSLILANAANGGLSASIHLRGG